MQTLEEMKVEVRDWTVRKGWRGYEAPIRTMGADLALLTSEISEALEAYRVAELKRWYVPHDTFIYVEDGSFNYRGYKPEGVASELADLLIRLLDNYAEHGLQVPRWEDVEPITYLNTVDFGTEMSGLAWYVSRIFEFWYMDGGSNGTSPLSLQGYFDELLVAIVTEARQFEVDLYAEYRAKQDYNETRSHRHGGKNL